MEIRKVVFIILVLFILCHGQSIEISEQCIRCLCHARTGCNRMKNCASYSISQQYWVRGGNNTVADDLLNSQSYSECQKNEACIINTIRGYIQSFPQRDCNCDGDVECKDFAAIHLKGDMCRSDFDANMLRRLDTCLTRHNIQNTPGWEQNCGTPAAV